MVAAAATEGQSGHGQKVVLVSGSMVMVTRHPYGGVTFVTSQGTWPKIVISE